MEKLDLKDRKILYQLDLNCRQSNTQIGKKVGLSRKVVEYRIKKMEDEGIITGYWTEINTFRLGFDAYRLYLNFQDVSLNIKNEIIEYFSDYRNAWAVMSIQGPIDLDVMIWVDDSQKFHHFWNITLDKYGKYFSRHTISVLTGGIAFKKSYLITDEYKKSEREYFVLKSGGKSFEIDEIDHIILDELAVNSRIPIIELAEKTNCSSQTVSYRIKNLQKNKIILAFRVGIDETKLGYINSCIDIYLNDHTQRKKCIDYIKSIPYIEYLIEGIGWCDIELELIVKNIEHLTEIMENIDSNFPDAIRKQDFWMTKKYHRLRSLPEMEFK